jgi:GNAT superfamily N-acetyltransferase
MSRLRLVRDDFDAFFQVPFQNYGPDVPYVSPLRSDLKRMVSGRANPTFANPDDLTHFTVVKGDTPRGRITAHIHRAYTGRFRRRTGFFGFFDTAPDPAVASTLLDRASDWLRARGCDEMMGGFNLTASQEMGIVTDGHDQAPFMAQAFNPSWTPELLVQNGFEPVFPMTSWRLDLNRFDADRLLGPRQRELLDQGFMARHVPRREFRRWLTVTRRLLNDSFDQNPHFVPLSKAEFDFQAGSMVWVYDPRISFMGVKDGEPVGVVACLPDVNPLLRKTGSRLRLSTPFHFLRHRRRPTRATIIFGGVRPDWQNRGVVGLLLHRAIRAMQDAGYREVGITWVSDTNHASLRQMEKLGATPLHRLALFRRSL